MTYHVDVCREAGGMWRGVVRELPEERVRTRRLEDLPAAAREAVRGARPRLVSWLLAVRGPVVLELEVRNVIPEDDPPSVSIGRNRTDR